MSEVLKQPTEPGWWWVRVRYPFLGSPLGDTAWIPCEIVLHDGLLCYKGEDLDGFTDYMSVEESDKGSGITEFVGPIQQPAL